MPQNIHIEDTLPLTVYRFIRLAVRAERTEMIAALAETRAEHVIDTPTGPTIVVAAASLFTVGMLIPRSVQ